MQILCLVSPAEVVSNVTLAESTTLITYKMWGLSKSLKLSISSQSPFPYCKMFKYQLPIHLAVLKREAKDMVVCKVK